ncbi:hypothetical protein acsn021_02640 [Anaerocolumna cellulosilytica]|uniref:Uncharacterized protein n=1 Tax=Anaerocolumna cellulosilytica TaxID=433286 RepID=A0A6S6QZ72_9FIRM|nr:hypothetical protein [Anaerocolumna cellulosilytica]MBB5196903.1 hypothetical protein [Anaerocolumna cellulosilytica]BCJ92695.1 hypothetical protein acsn021_02640 [Anaerocolumna cellulosilytica]
MKRKPLLRKILYLLLLFIFPFVLSACRQNSKSMPETTGVSLSEIVTVNSDESTSGLPQTSSDDESSVNNDTITAYDNFLAGSINAQDLKHEISDGVVTINDISMEPDFKTYYALFDMNGDGIPELHLRPIAGGSYSIFTYLDGQIVLWHNGPDYESPLNNGAILYERDGAAPTHVNYYYLVLDSQGDEISKVYFSKYHSVDESGTTESTDYEVFMFEDKEVSKDEWNSLTDEYLSHSSELIVWNEL